jgi:hypothetical protein
MCEACGCINEEECIDCKAMGLSHKQDTSFDEEGTKGK